MILGPGDLAAARAGRPDRRRPVAAGRRRPGPAGVRPGHRWPLGRRRPDPGRGRLLRDLHDRRPALDRGLRLDRPGGLRPAGPRARLRPGRRGSSSASSVGAVRPTGDLGNRAAQRARLRRPVLRGRLLAVPDRAARCAGLARLDLVLPDPGVRSGRRHPAAGRGARPPAMGRRGDRARRRARDHVPAERQSRRRRSQPRTQLRQAVATRLGW